MWVPSSRELFKQQINRPPGGFLINMNRRIKMANEIRSVGIIGLGSFGAFAASLIPRDITVLGHDPHRTEAPASAEQVSMAEAGAADVVMLAIPLSAYPAVLTA